MQFNLTIMILAVIALLLAAGLVLASIAMRRNRKKNDMRPAPGGDVRAAIDRCDAQAGTAIRLIISALGQAPGTMPAMGAPEAESSLAAGDKAYLEFLSGENARLEEELASARQQLIEADNKNQINDEVITVAQGEKAKAEKERDEAKSALEASQAKVKELEADLSKKKEEVEDGKADIEALRSKNSELDETIKSKNKELDEKDAELEKAQDQVGFITKQNDELIKNGKTAEDNHAADLAKKNKELEAKEKVIAAKDAELADKEKTIADKEAEIKELGETLAKVSAEAKGSRTDEEFKVLENAILEKDRRILALTAAMERVRRDGAMDIDPEQAVAETATDIAAILDHGDDEAAIAALRRVGINDSRDLQRWSRVDLLAIPMMTGDALERIKAFGVTFAEGSDEAHRAAIRIPDEKINKITEANPDIEDNEVLNTPILKWRPKSIIDNILLVRLSEYGIETVRDLVMVNKYYLQTLPGIANSQRESILRALRGDSLDLGMTEKDLRIWAGHWLVEQKKKGQKKAKRVATLPFNNAEAAVLNKDAVRCGVVHFGPLGNGKKTFVENTGIETLGDLASLHHDDVELLYFFYGGDKLEKALKVLENNGLHLGMNDEHRKDIVESKEVYMRGADALQLPIAVVLPTRKNICERLAGKGCHVLGDLKEITFEEAITIGVDKDTITYLRDNCKARGINGVIEHSQEK